MIGDKTKSIYLASPYTHENPEVVAQRHRDVCKVAGELMKLHKIVFCPIAHTHHIATVCDIHCAWGALWATQDLYWVGRCDEFGIVMLEGWKESAGVAAEEAFARKHKKTIIYIQPKRFLEM